MTSPALTENLNESDGASNTNTIVEPNSNLPSSSPLCIFWGVSYTCLMLCEWMCVCVGGWDPTEKFEDQSVIKSGIKSGINQRHIRKQESKKARTKYSLENMAKDWAWVLLKSCSSHTCELDMHNLLLSSGSHQIRCYWPLSQSFDTMVQKFFFLLMVLDLLHSWSHTIMCGSTSTGFHAHSYTFTHIHTHSHIHIDIKLSWNSDWCNISSHNHQ